MATKKETSAIRSEETQIMEQRLTSSNAPKIISTVDVNLKLPKLDAKYYRARFVEDYNHCPLCGDELLFTHVTQFVESSVSEEAHCESCHVQTKKNSHKLH